MEIKTMPPVNVLFFTARTTLKELSTYAITVAKQLYAACSKQQLLPTGPIHWIYYGADGNPDTVFTLEIALPVDEAPQTESLFLYKQLPAFKCAVATHDGAWDQLGQAYGKLIPEIMQGGNRLSGLSRELYINIDVINPENNITQIQVGIE